MITATPALAASIDQNALDRLGEIIRTELESLRIVADARQAAAQLIHEFMTSSAECTADMRERMSVVRLAIGFVSRRFSPIEHVLRSAFARRSASKERSDAPLPTDSAPATNPVATKAREALAVANRRAHAMAVDALTEMLDTEQYDERYIDRILALGKNGRKK